MQRPSDLDPFCLIDAKYAHGFGFRSQEREANAREQLEQTAGRCMAKRQGC